MKKWLRNKMDSYKYKKNCRDLYFEKVPVASQYVIK
jgi:hypothetical protein